MSEKAEKELARREKKKEYRVGELKKGRVSEGTSGGELPLFPYRKTEEVPPTNKNSGSAKDWSPYCCNETISDYFQTYQFENLFAKRNTPVAHAVGFWDYHSFITVAEVY